MTRCVVRMFCHCAAKTRARRIQGVSVLLCFRRHETVKCVAHIGGSPALLSGLSRHPCYQWDWTLDAGVFAPDPSACHFLSVPLHSFVCLLAQICFCALFLALYFSSSVSFFSPRLQFSFVCCIRGWIQTEGWRLNGNIPDPYLQTNRRRARLYCPTPCSQLLLQSACSTAVKVKITPATVIQNVASDKVYCNRFSDLKQSPVSARPSFVPSSASHPSINKMSHHAF